MCACVHTNTNYILICIDIFGQMICSNLLKSWLLLNVLADNKLCTYQQECQLQTSVGIQDEEDEDGVVDLDMNLVTSLLQSYMNQEGMPGPASNLLGAMGIKLSDPSEKNLSKGGKR